jgi:hypothetical protein
MAVSITTFSIQAVAHAELISLSISFSCCMTGRRKLIAQEKVGANKCG